MAGNGDDDVVTWGHQPISAVPVTKAWPSPVQTKAGKELWPPPKIPPQPPPWEDNEGSTTSGGDGGENIEVGTSGWHTGPGGELVVVGVVEGGGEFMGAGGDPPPRSIGLGLPYGDVPIFPCLSFPIVRGFHRVALSLPLCPSFPI